MKRFTFLMVSLCLALLTFGQVTVKVQGVPRTVSKDYVVKATNVCDVDFSKIKRWVGKGSNSSALVIRWNDDKDENKSLVWGYKWDGEKKGADMLADIAAADPSFYYLVYGKTQYGSAFGGFGFDLNGDGNIGLMKKDKECELVNNICFTSQYDFDDYTAKDEADHWKSGWYKGFWGYSLGTVGEAYKFSGVGASGRKLTDKCVDLWSFSAFSGSKPTITTSELYYLPEIKYPYTDGVFVVNEDWYGHNNSTVNFFSSEGKWTYRVVQKANPGVELGATADFGAIYGDRFYIISKQAKDPGATVQGARITICNAKTMKVLKQIADISADESVDGRGFVGVDEHKGYVGTTNGIFVLDLDAMAITGKVDGSAPEKSNQIGNMVRVNDKVYAVHLNNGILVIDPATDKVVKTIAGKYGSIVLSKDGNLWLSDTKSNNSLIKLDPKTDELTTITLPDGIYGPANSVYAWTPDGFCASKQNNVLYWNGGTSSWFSGKMIFKYDIDTQEASKFIDYSDNKDGWQIYGCSFRIDPVSDHAFVTLFKGYGDTSYAMCEYDENGYLLKVHSMEKHYWFPGMFVFPDNAEPVVKSVAETVSGSDNVTVDLMAVATDADNMEAAIVKTVTAISDEEVIGAVMENGNLVVTPKKDGTSNVTIKVNSNGKIAECVVAITVKGFVGVGDINAEDATEVARYTIDGRLLTAPERGVNIIRMSDGTVKKVLVK